MTRYEPHDVLNPVTVGCAGLVIASGVFSIIKSRKSPSDLSHALMVHGFTMLVVVTVGFVCHFLGYFTIFTMKNQIPPDHYDYFQDAMDRAYVTKRAIWFSIIALIGGMLGVIALLIKKKPNKS